MNSFEELKHFLDLKVKKYNQFGFIANDPIQIPHLFSKKQDIEIMGFWAATLAWGQRVTILNKCKELIELMDGSPHDFILHHQENDLKRFSNFKHRTFNYTDTLYFIHFFKIWYTKNDSLENAFLGKNTEEGINNFRKIFLGLDDFPKRTIKHVSSPKQNSACKRINMFLRWMVRKDNSGVDFGIWNSIRSSDLICPLDVHVERVARKLGLITRTQCDWKTALELTEQLRKMDANDPVKYDFALFGLGIEEKFR